MFLPNRFVPASETFYFAGGYMRQVNVTAEGYEGSTHTEGPHATFNGRLLVLPLTSIRNRFGAVRVIEIVEHDAKRVITTFDVLDGTRAGTQLRLPMFSIQRELFPLGAKFYLTVSVDELERVRDKSPNIVFASTHFLRHAIHNEPYAPPLK